MFTYYFNPFLGQILICLCTVAPLQPILMVIVEAFTTSNSDHHTLLIIVGITLLENYWLDMTMILMVLPCQLGMIKTFSMTPYQQQTFQTLTLVNYLDEMVGKGSVSIRTDSKITSSRITSSSKGLLC